MEAYITGGDDSIKLQKSLEDQARQVEMPDPVTPEDFLNLLLSSEDLVAALAEDGLPLDSDYVKRIAAVAYERYTARGLDADVPTLIIVPKQLTMQQQCELLGDRVNYVMIFGAESIFFQDTVHEFAVDSQDCEKVNVLGAHIDWVLPDNKTIARALAVDRTGLVKEVSFQEPVPIDVAQILHLRSADERQVHRELSARLKNGGVPQINPYENSSERADDKALTHKLWNRYGQDIVSPEHALIPQGSSTKEIFEILRSFSESIKNKELVVQTNKGTEGRKVSFFDASVNLLPIVDYIRDVVLPEDDAIVRDRRGNVKYREPSSDSLLNVTFRINVAWNGSAFVAESGYAQLAKDEGSFVASRGRGGSIIDINSALASLFYPRNEKWIRFIPTDEDIELIRSAATKAVRALNAGLDIEDYLKHAGVDILLEVEESESDELAVTPVVLEVNCRPAGLARSSEIMGISIKKPQPLISTEIFKFVEDLRQ